MDRIQLKDFLDARVLRYNGPEFIEKDPISIPHLFTRKQDIEIMGFWTAMLTWGQRVTTINKSKELIQLMDGDPYAFICHHEASDLRRFAQFKHRTFNLTDTLYFIEFFTAYYHVHDSLESAFLVQNDEGLPVFSAEKSLNAFRKTFFALPNFPARTTKHVSAPETGSTVKRINMFLRWMVRRDTMGVDFGIWQAILPGALMIPLDVHVERVARKLGLLDRPQRDWKAVQELTQNLISLDPVDPIQYDFALFNLGIEEHF